MNGLLTYLLTNKNSTTIYDGTNVFSLKPINYFIRSILL